MRKPRTKMNAIPISGTIERDQLIDDVLAELNNNVKSKKFHVPYQSGKIFLNKFTLEIILKTFEMVIMYYLKDWPEFFDDIEAATVVKLNEYLSFYSYQEPEKKAKNNLDSGKEYVRKTRRRYKATFAPYHQRVWNKLDV